MSINRVVLSGNLTRDPEVRALPTGTPVVSFGIAVNDRRRNPQSGEWEDYPNFVDCSMFGSRGESVSRYLSKGTKVAIEGKLRYHSWTTQDGQKRSRLEVVIDEIEFMSRGQQGQGGGYQQQAQGGGYQSQQQAYQPQQQAQGGGYQPQQQAYQQQAPVAATPPYQQAPAAPAQPAQASDDFYDEDIPF